MKTLIVAKQITVTDDLKAIIEKKLEKFDKFFNNNASATVVLSRERKKEILELTITVGGTLFRAEEENDTFRNALDNAVDIIERQIRKNKTRLQKRLRDTYFDHAVYDIEEDDEEDDAPYKIREKTFPARPMSVDEAILQMNLLGHQFFVFVNADTEKTNVIYKRRENEYGLLAPED